MNLNDIAEWHYGQSKRLRRRIKEDNLTHEERWALEREVNFHFAVMKFLVPAGKLTQAELEEWK